MKKGRPNTTTKVVPPGEVVRAYIPQVARHKGLFWLVAIGTIGIQVAGLISPLYLRQFFNIIASSSASPAVVHQLLVTIGFIALFTFLGWAFTRLQSRTIIVLEARAMSDLYQDAFDYLIGHSYQFFISQFTGTLTRRLSKYASSFETLFDSAAQTFAPVILYVIGAVGILFVHNHVLGVALGIWAVCFIAFQVWVSRLRQPIRMVRAEADSALTGTIADAITNQNTISLFSGGAHEHDVTGKSIGVWKAATLRSWIVNDYISGAQGFFMAAINVGLLWGALIFWERGELTVGDFVLIQSYLLGIFSNLNSITGQLRQIYDAFADAGEMVYILKTPQGIQDVPGAHDLKVSDGRIVFDHVDFSFSDSRPILRDFNVEIEGGQKVALVGPSGAGKTTITKLLLRLYDVVGGSITIDGQNISTVTQESLRNAIAFVPQEPILFHRSLMENIRYGRRDATEAEVIEAARRAHCDEFIALLPEGYNTFVGERGVRLSGGERQRIAIARAILKNAPILVLDEATSSLDSASELLIQESLATLMQDKTVLVIAHRLSTIQNVNRILVIESGSIVAQGTHQALLAQGGLYKNLWSIQAGGFLQNAR